MQDNESMMLLDSKYKEIIWFKEELENLLAMKRLLKVNKFNHKIIKIKEICALKRARMSKLPRLFTRIKFKEKSFSESMRVNLGKLPILRRKTWLLFQIKRIISYKQNVIIFYQIRQEMIMGLIELINIKAMMRNLKINIEKSSLGMINV